jgi:hypothetical protein
METYDPTYDGYAAQAGFQTGDLIVSMDYCEFRVKELTEEDIANMKTGKGFANKNSEQKVDENSELAATTAVDGDATIDVDDEELKRQHACKYGVQEELVSITMKTIPLNLTDDDEWKRIAQSCEQIAPTHKTKFRVRRSVPDDYEEA